MRRLAFACLGTIAAADYVIHTKDPSWFAIGPLDHAAHLATAGLIALNLKRPPGWTASFLAGSLLPDIDHVPLAFRDPEPGDPRPGTHSLLSALPVALGSRSTASGVLAHFVRDLALAPGAPLLWPLSRKPLRIPYVAYAVALSALGGLASRRD